MGHRCHRTGDDCLRRNLRSSAKLWGMKSIVSLRFKVPHEIMADSNLLSVARPGTERERESALCICGICATTDRSKRNSGESTSWVLPVCHHRISLLCCSSHPEDTTRHSIYRLQIAFFFYQDVLQSNQAIWFKEFSVQISFPRHTRLPSRHSRWGAGGPEFDPHNSYF